MHLPPLPIRSCLKIGAPGESSEIAMQAAATGIAKTMQTGTLKQISKGAFHREIARSALLGSSSRGVQRRSFISAGCYIVRSRHRILNRRRKLHFDMLRTRRSRHGGASTRLLHIFGCLAAFLAHFSLSKSLPWALLTICRPAWARTVRPPIGISRYARRLR